MKIKLLIIGVLSAVLATSSVLASDNSEMNNQAQDPQAQQSGSSNAQQMAGANNVSPGQVQQQQFSDSPNGQNNNNNSNPDQAQQTNN